MEKIEKLTPEQEAQLPGIRDEWLQIGTCTDRADRPRAEAGVRLAYEAAGLTPPPRIEWRDSPRAGAERIAELCHGEVTEAHVRTAYGQAIFGQHNAGWLSFYDAFGRVLHLDCVKPLEGLMEVARSAGWWWAFDEVAVITERQSKLILDDDDRLHCTDGPAIAYPDGYGVYAIHGIRINPDWIEKPESITPEMINTEENAELARVLLNLYGEERYLSEIDARVIAEDTDELGQPRKLLQANVSWSTEPLTMVRVLNSTAESDGSFKPYYLRVPASVSTPLEAVAWTFGVEPDLYRPVIQT